jgi:hypothetical protein
MRRLNEADLSQRSSIQGLEKTAWAQLGQPYWSETWQTRDTDNRHRRWATASARIAPL